MLARDLHADLTASDPANPGNRRGSFLTRRFNRIIILFPDHQPLHAASDLSRFPFSEIVPARETRNRGEKSKAGASEWPAKHACMLDLRSDSAKMKFSKKKEGKIKIRCSRARLPRLRNFRASRLASTREKLLFSVGRSERALSARNPRC